MDAQKLLNVPLETPGLVGRGPFVTRLRVYYATAAVPAAADWTQVQAAGDAQGAFALDPTGGSAEWYVAVHASSHVSGGIGDAAEALPAADAQLAGRLIHGSFCLGEARGGACS